VVWRSRVELLGFLPFLEGLTSPQNLWWMTMALNPGGRLTPGIVKPLHGNALSRERPALAALDDKLVTAWKGVNVNTLYFSTCSEGSENMDEPCSHPRRV
jgi:hypothetical protein